MPLTNNQLRKAARLNPKYARRLGWATRFSRVVAAIGQTPGSMDTFSQQFADWQARQPNLSGDGILGPKSWTRLQKVTPPATTCDMPPVWLTSQPLPSSTAGAGTEPSWYRYALAQQVRWANGGETVREEDTTWDEDYFMASPRWGNSTHTIEDRPRDNAHWCAAFVNWCLHRAGYSHTGSAGARSFTRSSWWSFEAREQPQVGCVIVMNNPNHVAFLASTEGLPSSPNGNVTRGRFDMLGGNQGGTVRISRGNAASRTLLAARGQNGVRSPYLWPLQGSPNCNIELESDAAHYCHYIREE